MAAKEKPARKGAKRTLDVRFEIDRESAILAKRALQSALDRVDRVRANLLQGALNIDLDLAHRDITVVITALRDADRAGRDGDLTLPGEVVVRIDERNPLKNDREFMKREPRAVKCPTCGRIINSRALKMTTCTDCGNGVTIKGNLV